MTFLNTGRPLYVTPDLSRDYHKREQEREKMNKWVGKKGGIFWHLFRVFEVRAGSSVRGRAGLIIIIYVFFPLLEKTVFSAAAILFPI